MTKKNIWESALWYFFYVITMIQSLMMLWFFGKQFGNLTIYANTTEYLEIAKNLQTDEYMGILYPLFIRCAIWLENVLVFSYYQIIYVAQLVIMIVATAFFVGSYSDTIKSRMKYLIIVSFLVSIPMLAAMYTGLEPVTLQMALWLFVLGCVKRVQIGDKKIPYSIGIVLGSIALVLLVPNDRYVLLLFYAIIMTVAIVKKRERKRWVAMSLLFIAGTVACMGILKSGEGRGRMEQNLHSAWFLECTSPHFAKDYVCWPEEVRSVIPFEEAVLMVRRDDGLLFGIDDALVEAYGRKMTDSFYRQMGNTAFSMHTKETVFSFRDDVLQGVFTPFSIMNHKNSGYNSKDGYWYSDFPGVFSNAGKYIYFGSIIALTLLLIGKVSLTIMKMWKEKRVIVLSEITCMVCVIGLGQVISSAYLDVGAMDYSNYPIMIFLWYFMAIVL